MFHLGQLWEEEVIRPTGRVAILGFLKEGTLESGRSSPSVV